MTPREEEPCWAVGRGAEEVARRRPLVAAAGMTDQRCCKGGEPGDDQGRGMHRSEWQMMGLDQVEAEEWGDVGRFRIEF